MNDVMNRIKFILGQKMLEWRGRVDPLSVFMANNRTSPSNRKLTDGWNSQYILCKLPRFVPIFLVNIIQSPYWFVEGLNKAATDFLSRIQASNKRSVCSFISIAVDVSFQNSLKRYSIEVFSLGER